MTRIVQFPRSRPETEAWVNEVRDRLKARDEARRLGPENRNVLLFFASWLEAHPSGGWVLLGVGAVLGSSMSCFVR